jgi:hypothetical protein
MATHYEYICEGKEEDARNISPSCSTCNRRTHMGAARHLGVGLRVALDRRVRQLLREPLLIYSSMEFYYRLSIPYLSCLKPEVFSNFRDFFGLGIFA